MCIRPLYALLLLVGCLDGQLDVFTAQAAGAGGAAAGGPPVFGGNGGGGAGAGVGGTEPAGSGGAEAGSGGAEAGSGGAEAGSGNHAGQPLLVDDFEDGDTRSLARGWWYQQNDATGEQFLEIGMVADRPPGLRAAHTFGGGFTAWGAILGLNLTSNSAPLDGSRYSELRFWARAGIANMPEVNAELLDPTGAHFGLTFQLDAEWRQYVLRFADLPHTEGDITRRLNPAQLSAFQIFVLSDQAFDFWVDDVMLVP